MKNIKFEKIENFRDLGGYECRYGETSFGVIYRSATLAYASNNDIKKIENLGIKTVIDLREEITKKNLPNPFKNHAKVGYIPLNVNGNGRIPKDYNDGIDSYFEMLEDPYTVRKILKSIIFSPKPLVIHCNAGKDRTGVFAFLILLMNGVDFYDLNADYMLSFPYLFNMTIDTMKNHPEVTSHVLTPNIFYMKDFYDQFLERYGSGENYCESIGLNDEEINALANILGKRDQSFGAIVINQQNKILIEHMKEGHFALPKGHKENVDSHINETIMREVLEETGIRINVLEGYEGITFYSPKDGMLKEVVYKLARTYDSEIKIQKEEVDNAYFLNIDDAIRVLTYQSDKDILIEGIKKYIEIFGD